MSAGFLSRIGGAIITMVSLFSLGWEEDFQHQWGWTMLVSVVLSSGLIAFIITPYISIHPYRWMYHTIQHAPVEDIVAATIGLIIGLSIAATATIPLSQLSIWNLCKVLPFLAVLLFGYLGVATVVFHKQDLAYQTVQIWTRRQQGDAEHEERDRANRKNDKSQNQEGGDNRESCNPILATNGSEMHDKGSDTILLDISAIIDGRIADISRTGFVSGTLVVPRFVLEALQRVAESPDSLQRNRGRQSLDTLTRLQKETDIPLEITDEDVAGATDVDAKLIKLAHNLDCPIITSNFTFNDVARLQGVKVLNINELANAVKPVLLPGEEMSVKIIQKGDELGQGIGYLDDGTMIVVEGGRQHMNTTVEVTITRVLQTVAGRMIFTHARSVASKQ